MSVLPFCDANQQAQIIDTYMRMRHWFSPAVQMQTSSVNINQTTKAVLAASANPLRVALGLQLSSGMTAYFGNVSSVQPSDNGQGPPGFQMPVGGGWTFGPEWPGDLYVIATATGRITVVQLLSDVAYPLTG